MAVVMALWTEPVIPLMIVLSFYDTGKFYCVGKVLKGARTHPGSEFSLLPRAIGIVAKGNQGVCRGQINSLPKATYNAPIMYVIGCLWQQLSGATKSLPRASIRCIVASGNELFDSYNKVVAYGP